MKRSESITALLAALMLSGITAATAQTGLSGLDNAQREIYGDNDLMNLSDVNGKSGTASAISPELAAKLAGSADSVVALFKKDDIDANGRLTLQPFKTSLHETLSLCPGSAFENEKTGSFCSGSLIGSNLILTAGHCVRTLDECMQTKVVFGWSIKDKDGNTPETVSTSEVYSCKNVLSAYYDDETEENLPANKKNLDYSIIVLDRDVKNHKPLKFNRGKIATGTKLAVIGHPAGLAQKITPGGKVRTNTDPIFFVTDLDTFGGNSGSPVFNISTMKVEGVLVRGGTDFIEGETESGQRCVQYHVSAQEEGKGEDVTRSSVVVKYLERKIAASKKKQVNTAGSARRAKSVISSALGQ